MGSPFKKMLFPVQRPGEHITAEWELFFLILHFFFFFGQNFIIFLPQKKYRFFFFVAAARLAIIPATRWTGNKLFFKGGLVEESCT